MRRDDVVKRLEKMGYKVTYLFNGKLMILSKSGLEFITVLMKHTNV